jgi:formylglycine-generating enzyme required for sulfatase activity
MSLIALFAWASGSTLDRAVAALEPEELVSIPGGTYRPVYPPSPEETTLPIASFLLDRRPVTNAKFLAFVLENPEWQRGTIAPLLADPAYLSGWAGPTHLGSGAPARAPVTQVSWYAAKAYCHARGARLPTEAEWEYAAAASDTRADGRSDPAWIARILSWYGRPGSADARTVGLTPANYYGVEDLHGLVWEWVFDFNSTLVSSDSRESGDPDKMRFCGAGAITAADREDYASFMRIAMRSSLRASYTTGTLGFRCARDGEPR